MNVIAVYLRELRNSIIEVWNGFWFTPADPATLGLIRILTGTMLIYTHLVWSVDLVGFFGPEGRLQPEFSRLFHGTGYAWSHLYGIQSPATLWTVHVIALLILILFALGISTRVTSVLSFLITVSYAHRAVGALFGLDQINGFLALYLAVGPSGQAYSVDAYLRSRRRRGHSPASESILANIAIRLIQLHMCIVYLFAGFGKLLGESWWAGTALWGAFANYEYQTLDMTWLAWYPMVVNLMTQVTLVWEITYSVFVWPKLTRPLVLCLAVPLHLGIGLCMGMMTFGLIMLIGNLAFVSPGIVRAVVEAFSFGRAGQGGT